jgi:deazaflavin-dependent oxidoreductase (nitroreductase family)
MAYLKPPAIVSSVFNKFAMQVELYGVATLSVTGRKTGRTQQIPVIPVDLDGTRYVVSVRGESDWVRNLRIAGTCELRRKGLIEQFHATEVPVGEREAVLDAYRAKAGRTVELYWRRLADPADHPTFRLTQPA